jgi:hypothetical protein
MLLLKIDFVFKFSTETSEPAKNASKERAEVV